MKCPDCKTDLYHLECSVCSRIINQSEFLEIREEFKKGDQIMRPKEAVDQAYEKAVNRFKTEIGPILKDIVQEHEDITGYLLFDGRFNLDDENNVEDVEFSREDRR